MMRDSLRIVILLLLNSEPHQLKDLGGVFLYRHKRTAVACKIRHNNGELDLLTSDYDHYLYPRP